MPGPIPRHGEAETENAGSQDDRSPRNPFSFRQAGRRRFREGGRQPDRCLDRARSPRRAAYHRVEHAVLRHRGAGLVPHSNCGEASNPSQHEEVSMSPTKDTPKSAKRTTPSNKKVKGFTDEERAAMKERAQELKADARRGPRADKADGESDVLAKIAQMPEPDRAMAKRLHAIIKASAPALSPKTWYGMPAYAKDDKVVCFFQSAQQFKSRYATFGFTAAANLDEGALWPTAFALKEFTAAEEARIGALVKRAVS